jgi:hypothetical protein
VGGDAAKDRNVIQRLANRWVEGAMERHRPNGTVPDRTCPVVGVHSALDEVARP